MLSIVLTSKAAKQLKHPEFKQDLHKKAEIFYMRKFDGKKDEKEKYGDFFKQVDKTIVGFEVYTPEEPLSISTKMLKEHTLKRKRSGNMECTSIGGGLDPNRLNQLIERALAVKRHQFTDKVTWPKLLIICCYYPDAFSGLDNFTSEWDTPLDDTQLKEYNYCSAIFIDSPFARSIIDNSSNAEYPLTKTTLKELKMLFTK